MTLVHLKHPMTGVHHGTITPQIHHNKLDCVRQNAVPMFKAASTKLIQSVRIVVKTQAPSTKSYSITANGNVQSKLELNFTNQTFSMHLGDSLITELYVYYLMLLIVIQLV